MFRGGRRAALRIPINLFIKGQRDFSARARKIRERKPRLNKVFWRVFPASSSLVGRIGPRYSLPLLFRRTSVRLFHDFFVNTLGDRELRANKAARREYKPLPPFPALFRSFQAERSLLPSFKKRKAVRLSPFPQRGGQIVKHFKGHSHERNTRKIHYLRRLRRLRQKYAAETSQQLFVENALPHIFTREPGGGKISEAIRRVLLDGKNSEITDECEALLYAAARVQHLADRVAPALQAGKLVICDRYVDSSLAYQAGGRGIDEAVRKKYQFLRARTVSSRRDDLYRSESRGSVLPQTRRGQKRQTGTGRAMEFHRRVYASYKKLASENPARIVTIDGRNTPQGIFDNILRRFANAAACNFYRDCRRIVRSTS